MYSRYTHFKEMQFFYTQVLERVRNEEEIAYEKKEKGVKTEKPEDENSFIHEPWSNDDGNAPKEAQFGIKGQ